MGSFTTVGRQGFALTFFMLVLGVGAAASAGPAAALWVAISWLVALLFFVAVSFRRHREVLAMASEIDLILHGGRQVQFTNCREGDLAVLRNELGKMVDRLARTSASLEAERNALANALADISHQIRTPLTAIGLMVANLEGAEDAVERKRAVRSLEDLLERVSWLVATLLKLAKVDAGALKVDKRPTAVADVVRRAVSPVAMALDLRGVMLEVTVDEGASFEGDERWSAEALENIVKNCMEHTPPGGSIRIAATADALATRITVADTGPGIRPEDLPHIFERFYRAEPAPGEEIDHAEEGFGIGLALARALVGAQGGTVHASNGAGGGARFDLVFPSLTV